MRRINTLEPDYPELAEGLRRIRVTEYRHRLALLELESKANPNGLPVAPIGPDMRDEQKQAWLEQQKMAWFEQRRAGWEAGGKQTPWAEWVAERELQWQVNELPNRELQWRLHVAQHGREKSASP